MSWLRWKRTPAAPLEARKLDLPTLKRFARILVIDDDEKAFPLEAARRSGFSLEWWPQVDAAGLAALDRGEFDIIFLDIKGVAAPGISDTGDGRGILRHIKQRNPKQIVVAFSGDTYDLGALAFYRQADDQLPKPIAATTAIERLESLVMEHLSPVGRWTAMNTLMVESGLQAGQIDTVREELLRATRDGSAATLRKIKETVGDVANAVTILELARKLLELLAA